MKNLSVGKKLFFACLSIVLVLTVASVTSILLSDAGMAQHSYFYEHPYRVTNTARALQTQILTVRIAIKDYILIKNNQDMGALQREIDKDKGQVMAGIQLLRDRYLGDQADVDAFSAAFDQYWLVATEVMDDARAGRMEEAAAVSVTTASTAANAMMAALDKVIAVSNDKADEASLQITRTHDAGHSSSIAFLALALLASILLTVALTRNITRPIHAMMYNIRKVESGEAVEDIDTGGRRDELGMVVGAFNRMLAYLKTQRELNELKLTLEHHKTLEQFRITLMSIGDGVISTDIEGRVMNLNPVAERLTGWRIEDAKGRPIDEVFDIINAKTGKKAENPLARVLESGTVVGLANHTVLISKDGVHSHIADSAAPIRDDAGQLFGVVLVFRDVSEDYRKQEEIINMSFHDKLTGLYNRAFFEEEIIRMNTSRQMPLSLIMGDINGLKLINDTFGHQEGDRYLVAGAEAIKSCCRAEDIVARWGGDEFVVLLPKTTEEESQQICDRIVEHCARITGFAIAPSIAIGCAVQAKATRDYQKLLKDAETNMYRHKLLESSSIRSAIVASLDNSLNERDFGTEEHAQAMVSICSDAGRQLGLNASQCDELELLARLHDIGKIAINDSILMKPEPLTTDEWVSMKRHAEIGYRIAKSISGLEHVADGILSHHERWDGSGYPRGLAGEDIPFTARIVAVADAYDAMTRGRPYKPAMGTDEAIAELRKSAGTQFDPAVVAAFMQVLASKPTHEEAV